MRMREARFPGETYATFIADDVRPPKPRSYCSELNRAVCNGLPPSRRSNLPGRYSVRDLRLYPGLNKSGQRPFKFDRQRGCA